MKNIDTLVEKVVNGQVSVAELEQISRIVAHGELGASNHAVEVLLNRLNALSEENRIVREQYRQCNSSMASTGAVPFQDIAPLEKHEQMLCPFKICVDQAPDAILWLKQSAQIVYANDQACHLLGYCRDELLNLNLNQIVVGFDQDFWDKRWEVGRTGKNVDVAGDQHWNRHKDGHLIPVSVSTTTCYQADGALRIALVRDLTERKEIERRMMQSQKMEALGTLAGGVAHDFNNILSAIIGFADLARIGSDPDTTLHAYIQQICTAADRAKHLVEQILLFSRKSQAEKKILDIRSVIGEVLELIRASIPATIEIKQQIDGCPGAIFADRTQIHQAIMNLCTNAYHAMKNSGGVLEISLETIQVANGITLLSGDLKAGRYVKISVADSGHGMDKHVLAHVFEPYYTTKKSGEGTGLGLSTVLGILKDHQGGVHAFSVPNTGTTFQLLLPLVEAESDAPVVVDDQLPTGNECILFVDDEEPIVELTQELLGKLGYAIEGWSDVDAALAAYERQPNRYDLLITDIAMPKMSGDRFAAAVRRIRPELPIIICTGFSDRITDEIRRQLIISRILLKPVSARELAQTIRYVLDGR